MSNSYNYHISLIEQVANVSHKIVDAHPRDIKDLNLELYLLLVELSKISQQEGLSADDLHILIKCYIDISTYIQKYKSSLKNHSSFFKERTNINTKKFNNNIFILFIVSFFLLRNTCIPKRFVHEKSVILLLSCINRVSKLSIIIILKYIILIFDLIESKDHIHRCFYQLFFLLTKIHPVLKENESRYSYDRKLNGYKEEFEIARNIFKKNDLHFVISDDQQIRNILIQIYSSNLIFRLTRKSDVSLYRIKWFENLAEIIIDSSELKEFYECSIYSVLIMFKYYLSETDTKDKLPKLLYMCPDINWFKDILQLQLKEYKGTHNFFYNVNNHMLPHGYEWQVNFIYHWTKYAIKSCQIKYQNQSIEDFSQDHVQIEFFKSITFEDINFRLTLNSSDSQEINRAIQFFKRKSSLFVYSHKQRIEYLKLLINMIYTNSSLLENEVIEGPLYESLVKIIDSVLITVIEVREIYNSLSKLYLYQWPLLKKVLNMLYFDVYNRRTQDIFHFLNFLNNILLNWISKNTFNDQDNATLREFVEYADDISIIFMIKKSNNILIETAVINFFESISIIKSKWNINQLLLPTPKLMILLLMSNNWLSVSRTCEIIFNYKVQVKLLQKEHLKRESILLLNKYILIFCNALWRQNLFTNSIEEKTLNISEIIKLPEFIPEHLKQGSNELYSIKKSIAFSSLCAKFLKFMELSSNLEENRLMLNPNAIRDNVKMNFILFLKQKGCYGLYSFIKEFVTLMSNSKNK